VVLCMTTNIHGFVLPSSSSIKSKVLPALSCWATYRRRAVAPKIVVGSVSMMADAASVTASCRLSNLASCAPSFLMDYPQDGPKRRGAPRSRITAQAAA
jgi:uncharacterized membrane protein